MLQIQDMARIRGVGRGEASRWDAVPGVENPVWDTPTASRRYGQGLRFGLFLCDLREQNGSNNGASAFSVPLLLLTENHDLYPIMRPFRRVSKHFITR